MMWCYDDAMIWWYDSVMVVCLMRSRYYEPIRNIRAPYASLGTLRLFSVLEYTIWWTSWQIGLSKCGLSAIQTWMMWHLRRLAQVEFMVIRMPGPSSLFPAHHWLFIDHHSLFVARYSQLLVPMSFIPCLEASMTQNSWSCSRVLRQLLLG